MSARLLRSMLFVPGDSEKKLAKAAATGADALILDLEDSVDPPRKAQARGLAAEFLHARKRGQTPASDPAAWVRVNPLDDAQIARDLECIVPARPAGLVLPKCTADDVACVDRRLAALEVRFGLPTGATKLLPIATETPRAVLTMHGYARAVERLAALTWGAEDLAAALGAATSVDERGAWLPPYELARSLCLFAAAAAGVPAIDTVYTDFRDQRGLERQAAAAARDGFAGKLAIHPDQVEILNRAFVPTPEAIAYAHRVLDAFRAASGAGVVSLDGKMLDRPHLEHAKRVVALAAALEAS